MKHFLYLSALLLACLSLGSCAEDEIDNGGVPVTADNSVKLNVSFRRNNVTRAIGDPFVAEDAEKAINKLSFYVYPAKAAEADLVPFQRYVFDMTALPLEKDSVQISEIAKGEYDCTFILREGGGFECRIVALANLPDDFDQTNNLNTYAKLQAALLDVDAMPAVPSANPKDDGQFGLPMYAEITKMIKKTLTTDVAFDMQRVVARFDITNRAYNAAKEEDGFVLQSARIVNAKHTSFLIPAITEPFTAPGLTTDFAPVDDVNKILWASSNGEDGSGGTVDKNGNAIITDATLDGGMIEQRLWHALYTFENDDRDVASATTVEIKGMFRGAPFNRLIPFVNKDKDPVIIERNHRYLILINPASDLTDVGFSIQVTDWDAVDTINVKPTQKVKPELGSFATGFEPDADKTIAILTAGASFTFDATNPFDTDCLVSPMPDAASDTDKNVEWVKVAASDAEVVTKAVTGYKRTYTVAVEELKETGTRKAMLLIRNKANVTARDTLYISQTNPDPSPAPDPSPDPTPTPDPINP